ncbi:MAG: SDR family NAD(P)-dependent oxidoreductase [Nocardioidaceae bacterium]
MARNRIHVDAAPEAVFAVLSDPYRYSDWVVGASKVRAHEGPFPAPGARLHHAVGLGPLTLRDHTEVLASEPPRRISLRAKARPLGTARIDIELAGRAGGTEVLMDERPGDRLSSLLASNPIADAALRLRNAESLARLKRVVEGAPPARPARRRVIAGQRVLITGGSSGIGLATAGLLGRQGAEVALLARSEHGLQRAQRRLREQGSRAHAVSADVVDRDALAAAVDEGVRLMGGLDVVVAGAAGAAFGRFTDTSAEDFDRTVATVLGGTVNTIRAAFPHLERSAGAVVVTGSTAARMPLPGLSAYTASKHALKGFVDTLRIELREAGSPVTVALVNPGPVDTPLWSNLQSATGLLPPPPPDMYSPESVAEAIAGAIERHRDEITVGGSARAQIAAWSHLDGAATRALVALARRAPAGGDRPAGPGALRSGGGTGEVHGGFGGRSSVAVGAQRAWNSVLSTLGA